MDQNLNEEPVQNVPQVEEAPKVTHSPSSSKLSVLKNKKLLVLILIALAIPLTVGLALMQKDTQSHADASTVLSLSPAKVETIVGKDVDLAVYVTPGGNLVNFLNCGINYDPNYFEIV